MNMERNNALKIRYGKGRNKSVEILDQNMHQEKAAVHELSMDVLVWYIDCNIKVIKWRQYF